MKKVLTTFLILITSLSLVSCKKEKITTPKDVETPVIFSKVLTDAYFSVSGIELYNPSDEKVDLKDIFIEIYPSGTLEYDTRIALEGTIEPKGFFFVVKDDSGDEPLKLADQVYTGKYLTGGEAIVLKGGKTQKDIIGTIGGSYTYINAAVGGTLVRKEDRLSQRETFQIYDYITFLPERYDMLGSLETGLTEEDFKYGPRLTEEDRKLPFYSKEDKNIGGGGVAKVSVRSYNDGDTTYFNYPSELNISSSTRYYYIDTPETQQTRIEEFGHPASNFTNDLLKEAEELGLDIEVQTMKGLTTDGGFGRFFGNVYVDGYSLSYLLLKYGLAESSVTSHGNEAEVDYKGVSIESWMRQATYYAQENKLGIHGEIDPSYYYNGKDQGENIGFRKYFDKPYTRSEKIAVVKTEEELKSALQNECILTIEIANDIEVTNTLEITNKNGLNIIGFGNKLSSKDLTEIINIKNSENIIIENLVLDNNKTAINVIESSISIRGVIDLATNDKGIILDSKSSIEFGPNFNVKLMKENNSNAIIISKDSTIKNSHRLFKGIKLEEKIENTIKIYSIK